MDKELKDRVFAFKTLSLPGQPMFMHMGTSYLVSDLESALLNVEAERDRLRAEVAALKKDAERYRFVRTADGVQITNEEARDPVKYDAAIDSALKVGS